MSRKVLVMGGNGFIGRNIASFFSNMGDDIEIYDINKSTLNYKQHIGNVLDDKELNSIIKNVDIIIYLISAVPPKKSMEEPESAYKTDIPMLLKVLEYCTDSNCKRVIFASSGGGVYGDINTDLLKEDGLMEQPVNHYAICKLASEKILMLYNKLYGMENISLRISNPYGLGQRPESGIGVITVFVDKIAKNEEITLYGDGNIEKDFISIDTVANTFYNASKWKFDKHVTPVFNVGSGHALTINQIIEIISNELNIKPNINYVDSRFFDIKHNCLDMSKTEKYLGISGEKDNVEKIKKYVKALYNNYQK